MVVFPVCTSQPITQPMGDEPLLSYRYSVLDSPTEISFVPTALISQQTQSRSFQESQSCILFKRILQSQYNDNTADPSFDTLHFLSSTSALEDNSSTSKKLASDFDEESSKRILKSSPCSESDPQNLPSPRKDNSRDIRDTKPSSEGISSVQKSPIQPRDLAKNQVSPGQSMQRLKISQTSGALCPSTMHLSSKENLGDRIWTSLQTVTETLVADVVHWVNDSMSSNEPKTQGQPENSQIPESTAMALSNSPTGLRRPPLQCPPSQICPVLIPTAPLPSGNFPCPEMIPPSGSVSTSASTFPPSPPYTHSQLTQLAKSPKCLKSQPASYEEASSFLSPSEKNVYSRYFKQRFWTETRLLPRHFIRPALTTWEELRGLLDPNLRKVEVHRYYTNLFNNQPITRQLPAKDTCDLSKWTWREAWKSHIEMTIFSIENCPFIGQVVVDTGAERLGLPFKVNFLRLPIFHEEQVISIYFNSPSRTAYHWYYSPFLWKPLEELHQFGPLAKEKTDSIILTESFIQSLIDWDGLEEETLEILLDRDSHHALQALHEPYSPEPFWPTSYRFDIPVKMLFDRQEIETSVLIAPKGLIYTNNGKRFSPPEMFQWLERESAGHPYDCKIKLHIRLVYSGLHDLICLGDSTPPHLLSFKNHGLITIEDQSTFDAALYAYKAPLFHCNHTKGGQIFQPYQRALVFTTVYTAVWDDPIDRQIAVELNQDGGRLLFTSFYSSPMKDAPEKILRLAKGVYRIRGQQVKVILAPSAPIYGPSELVAFVQTESFQQPFKEFLLGTKTGLRLIAKMCPMTAANVAQDRCLRLPNFDLPTNQLPWGAQSNQHDFETLLLHGKAIHANLSRHLNKAVDPMIFGYLSPPRMKLTPQGAKVPVTFYWDGDGSNCRVDAVDLALGPRGGLPYLRAPVCPE